MGGTPGAILSVLFLLSGLVTAEMSWAQSLKDCILAFSSLMCWGSLPGCLGMQGCESKYLPNVFHGVCHHLHLYLIVCKLSFLLEPEHRAHSKSVCLLLTDSWDEEIRWKGTGRENQRKGGKCLILLYTPFGVIWPFKLVPIFIYIEKWAVYRIGNVQVTEGISWFRLYWDNYWEVGGGKDNIECEAGTYPLSTN